MSVGLQQWQFPVTRDLNVATRSFTFTLHVTETNTQVIKLTHRLLERDQKDTITMVLEISKRLYLFYLDCFRYFPSSSHNIFFCHNYNFTFLSYLLHFSPYFFFFHSITVQSQRMFSLARECLCFSECCKNSEKSVVS